MTKSPTNNLLNRFSHMFRKPEDEAPESEDLPRSSARQSDEMQRLRTALAGKARAAEGTHTTVPPIAESQGTPKEPWWGAGAEPGHTGNGPQAAQNTVRGAVPLPPDDDLDLDLDFTGMPSVMEAVPPPVPAKPAFTPFESSLRDAALQYAQGDFAAAQSTLTGLLADASLDSDTLDMLFFSLFDVYRCSGQQDAFDALALEYAQRFGRSPAEWFSLRDATPTSIAQSPSTTKPGIKPGPKSSWQCPPVLDAAALADCIAQQSTAGPVCSINWSALQHIDPAAVDGLTKQMAAWCTRPVELQWLGLASLQDLLKTYMTLEPAARQAGWWLIQLDLLRMLEQAQAFEDLALDYCVVFEVSPPSWQAVACKLVMDGDLRHGLDSVPTLAQPLTDGQPGKATGYIQLELAGNITGDSHHALMHLRNSAQQASEVSVSCARMGRLNMQAAANLVAWVKECNARGCAVQFIHLPRLVLVYFRMLGMEKVASLSAGSH